MTVGIDCRDCGSEVVFIFEDETPRPTAECECGAVYELTITRRA